jgi:DGQHR domain-containing protein
MTVSAIRPRIADANIELVIDAIPVRQHGRALYIGKMKVRDLDKQTKIDRYNPEKNATDEDQGYQRPEEKPRVRKMSGYLKREVDGNRSPLLPTAIVLSARGVHMEYRGGKLTMKRNQKLRVIDGQHRKAGLLDAVEGRDMLDILDYEVPVVIVSGMSRTEEMRQFKVINSTAKSVRTDLVSMLLANLSVSDGDSSLETSERIQATAAKVVAILNSEEGSSWKNRITLPNQIASGEQVTKATTVIASIKPVRQFFIDGLGKRFASTDKEALAIAAPLGAFWAAVEQQLPECWAEPHDYVLHKAQGVFALNIVCRRVMSLMFQKNEDWTAENFASYLERSTDLKDAHFWHVGDPESGIDRGEAARYLGMKGFSELAERLWDDINPEAD